MRGYRRALPPIPLLGCRYAPSDLPPRRRATATRLAAAVHRNRMFSREGALERIFHAGRFRGLVLSAKSGRIRPVDLEALQIRPNRSCAGPSDPAAAISSITSSADPARISAIDLNGAPYRAHSG